MKRTGELIKPRLSKKYRASDAARDAAPPKEATPPPPPFEGRLQKRLATDVYASVGRGTLEGYIELKVFMRWYIKATDNIRVQGEAVEDGQIVRFDIFFAGPCYDYLMSTKTTFDINDRLCLALKGATLHEEKRTGAAKMLPNYLLYKDGVLLQFLSKKTTLSTGMLLDVWPGNTLSIIRETCLLKYYVVPVVESTNETAIPKKKPAPDDWFSTPPPPAKEPDTDVPMDLDFLPPPQLTQVTTPVVVESTVPDVETARPMSPQTHPSLQANGTSKAADSAPEPVVLASNALRKTRSPVITSQRRQPEVPAVELTSSLSNKPQATHSNNPSTTHRHPSPTIEIGRPIPRATSTASTSTEARTNSKAMDAKEPTFNTKKAQKKASRLAKRATREARLSPESAADMMSTSVVPTAMATVESTSSRSSSKTSEGCLGEPSSKAPSHSPVPQVQPASINRNHPGSSAHVSPTPETPQPRDRLASTSTPQDDPKVNSVKIHVPALELQAGCYPADVRSLF